MTVVRSLVGTMEPVLMELLTIGVIVWQASQEQLVKQVSWTTKENFRFEDETISYMSKDVNILYYATEIWRTPKSYMIFSLQTLMTATLTPVWITEPVLMVLMTSPVIAFRALQAKIVKWVSWNHFKMLQFGPDLGKEGKAIDLYHGAATFVLVPYEHMKP